MHTPNPEDYFSASSELQRYHWGYRPTECRGEQSEDAEDPDEEPTDPDDADESEDEDDYHSADPPSNSGGEYAELGGDDDTSTW